MTLAFLTPDGAIPADSPMAGAAQRSGARLEVRDGWRVPVAYGEEAEEREAVARTVGFADASALPKFELHGPADAALALGRATARDGAWWCLLTPARTLVIGAPPGRSEAESAQVVDVTTQFCGLRIAGPLALPLLARFCALDLRPAVAPPTALRPGSVARTPGLVIVEGPDRLLVLAGDAFAEYLWTVVSDAATRLGGRPVRAQVLEGAPTGA
jgi:hypothetical protein